MIKVCANCGRSIFRQAGKGTWYHRVTASVSCRPGSGARGTRATPVEVSRDGAQ